jgi:hypothetical protein
LVCGNAQESKKPDASAPNVADRRENVVDAGTIDDAARREVTASVSPAADAVEAALADALQGATAAERWDVVVQLARELEARRMARAGNVVALRGHRGRRSP